MASVAFLTKLFLFKMALILKRICKKGSLKLEDKFIFSLFSFTLPFSLRLVQIHTHTRQSNLPHTLTFVKGTHIHTHTNSHSFMRTNSQNNQVGTPTLLHTTYQAQPYFHIHSCPPTHTPICTCTFIQAHSLFPICFISHHSISFDIFH